MVTNISELSSSSKFNWTIENFSKLNAHDGAYSDVFSVGCFKWKARIYPKGDSRVYDQLSLFLCPVNLTRSLITEFRFAVTSQTDRNNRVTKDIKYEFPENGLGRGWSSFMSLSELHNPDKGYLLNDTCVIKVEVTYMMMDSKDDDVANESNQNKVAKTEDEN
ncbi:hypothetical protein MKX03_014619 [Papaver bracteatum]|nr:hypothetical protein MKX03_014619 [Papaver bracteatum]